MLGNGWIPQNKESTDIAPFVTQMAMIVRFANNFVQIYAHRNGSSIMPKRGYKMVKWFFQMKTRNRLLVHRASRSLVWPLKPKQAHLTIHLTACRYPTRTLIYTTQRHWTIYRFRRQSELRNSWHQKNTPSIPYSSRQIKTERIAFKYQPRWYGPGTYVYAVVGRLRFVKQVCQSIIFLFYTGRINWMKRAPWREGKEQVGSPSWSCFWKGGG